MKHNRCNGCSNESEHFLKKDVRLRLFSIKFRLQYQTLENNLHRPKTREDLHHMIRKIGQTLLNLINNFLRSVRFKVISDFYCYHVRINFIQIICYQKRKNTLNENDTLSLTKFIEKTECCPIEQVCDSE